MTALALTSAALLSAAATAQTPPPPPLTAPAPLDAAPVDPARLATAQRVVAVLVPDGVYMNIMRDKMPAMMDAIMAQAGGMTGRQIAGETDRTADQTLDQKMATVDPQYRERTRIMYKVMFEELGAVFTRLEPSLRLGLSRSFARKFTAGQLNDMSAFFATPSGRAFASEYIATFVDPDVMAEMAKSTPEMMRAMPAIMQKAEAATAHLPPPPKARKTRPDKDD